MDLHDPTEHADDELDPEQDSEEEDLYKSFEFTADPGQEPLRVDKFIQNRVEKVSRNKIQNAAKAGAVKVNDKSVKSNYKVKAGDHIRLVVPKTPTEFKLAPENLPIDIVFEDNDVLVLNKRAGMVVHPGLGNWTGTLVNALLFHFDHLPVKDDETRPGLIHRLDKDTSGLLVIAKNEYAMSHLARQFFERTIKRQYVALVWGDFEEDEGTIEGNIGRNLRFRKKMAVFPDGDYGKHAVTHYKVLERFGYTTLVECRLETGRTHQIRVHMRYLNHPIFMDETYDGDQIVKGTIFTKYKQFVENCFKIMPRQALHAKSLGFVHPVSGEEMLFDSELPDDFRAVLEKWRTYSKHRL